jgi:hypothetical protein
MTIGPKPKPILTGATLHTICITAGPLRTYKLFGRVYGGKSDEDIDVHNPHTVNKLKMVSLYDFMLESFKHKGHCVVMDSTYYIMGDAMCQVGLEEEWGINMVGTVQSSRTGGVRLGRLLSRKRRSRRELTNHFSINTIPSHWFMLFGLTIALSRHFLIFILLLLLKEE